MAMGHKDDEQEELFVTHAGLRKGGGHPFYEALEKVPSRRACEWTPCVCGPLGSRIFP